VWLTALRAVLHLAGALAEIARARQLLGAGAAKEIARQAIAGLSAVAAAQAARRRVRHDDDSVVRDDPANRDGE
jgi:hypothetical protein